MAIDKTTDTQQDEIIHTAVHKSLARATGADVEDDGILTYHEDFQAAKGHLKLVQDAYNSDGGFLDTPRLAKTQADGTAESTGYLDYFSVREDEDRYELRRKRAYFVSWIQSLVSIPATYITTTGIHRDFSRLPKDPEKLIKSNFGSWEDSIKFLMIQATLYGVTVAGLDRSTKKSGTLKDDQDNPPRLLVLPPLQIPDWDICGSEFSWLKHFEPAKDGRGDPFKPKQALSNLRIWTPDQWRLYRQEIDAKTGNVVRVLESSGEHGYGQVPFRPLWSAPPQSGFYGPKQSWQVAKVNRRAFNQLSEIDDQLVGCCFNILCMPEVEGLAVDKEAGASTSLAYDPSLGPPPSFISPSSDPIEVCFEAVDRLRRYGYEIMRLAAADRGTKPATAVQQLFEAEETAKVVRDLAFQAEAFERDLLRLFIKVIGEDPDKWEDVIASPDTLKYPVHYNLELMSSHRVDELVKMMNVNWTSKTFRKALEKHYSTTSIPLDKETRKTVFKEVDESKEEVTFADKQAGSELPRIQKPLMDHGDLSSDTGGGE